MSQFEYHKAGNSQAQQDEALAYLFAQVSTGKAATGVLSGLAVSQTATASGSVLVDTGAGVVQAATLDGAGLLVNDSQATLDVFTANPMGSQPRNDIVVFDRATTSVSVVVGTPNATPTDPTVPTSAIPLARLRNAASAATIPTSAIDDLRSFTTLLGVPMDSGWVNLTLASGYTAVSGYPLQYCKIGRKVYLRGAVAYNGGGTITTLPADARPSQNSWLGSGISGTGNFEYTLLVATTGAISIPATYYNGTVATGNVLPIFGSFLLG